MVYKAIQSFLSEKASAFLPGKDYFPEEDKYASQFDPWSSGNRPVVRPWFNISINIQIGGGEVQAPAPAINQNFMPPARAYDDRRDGPPEPTGPIMRGQQQTAFERVLGQSHGYGNCAVQDHARAHFGDVHNYHYFYAHTMHRRASSPSETLSRSMAFEALSRSTRRTDHLPSDSAISDTPPHSPIRRQPTFRQGKS